MASLCNWVRRSASRSSSHGGRRAAVASKTREREQSKLTSQGQRGACPRRRQHLVMCVCAEAGWKEWRVPSRWQASRSQKGPSPRRFKVVALISDRFSPLGTRASSLEHKWPSHYWPELAGLDPHTSQLLFCRSSSVLTSKMYVTRKANAGDGWFRVIGLHFPSLFLSSFSLFFFQREGGSFKTGRHHEPQLSIRLRQHTSIKGFSLVGFSYI